VNCSLESKEKGAAPYFFISAKYKNDGAYIA